MQISQRSATLPETQKLVEKEGEDGATLYGGFTRMNSRNYRDTHSPRLFCRVIVFHHMRYRPRMSFTKIDKEQQTERGSTYVDTACSHGAITPSLWWGRCLSRLRQIKADGGEAFCFRSNRIVTARKNPQQKSTEYLPK